MAVQLYGPAAFTGTSPNDAYLTSYGNSTNLPASTQAFSYVAWLNFSSVAATPIQSVTGMYNGTNTASTLPTTGLQIGCGQSATVGAIDCWTWGGTILVSTAGNGVGFTAVTGVWYHVVYTCTVSSNGVGVAGTQTHNIYVNGALINTATNALQTVGTMTQVYINGFPQTVAQAEIYTETNQTQQDDIWIFGRQLSLAEIQTIYNAFGARDGIIYSLLARYHFDEAETGNVVNVTDYTGNGNTLFAVNRGGTTPTYIQDYSNNDTRPPLV